MEDWVAQVITNDSKKFFVKTDKGGLVKLEFRNYGRMMVCFWDWERIRVWGILIWGYG